MAIEAVVLTGGASRRMGEDKAKIPIDGIPQAERLVRQFLSAEIAVTVLGREPVSGAGFIRDAQHHAGPLAALKAFQASADFVFVASCDLPRFDVRIVDVLHRALGDVNRLAAAPEVDGFRQPLCALYRREAFSYLQNLEDQCAMSWLNAVSPVVVTEDALVSQGVNPAAARGANTKEELRQALQELA